MIKIENELINANVNLRVEMGSIGGFRHCDPRSSRGEVFRCIIRHCDPDFYREKQSAYEKLV